MSGNRGGLFGSTMGREEWKPYDEEDRERAGALQEDKSRACAAGSGRRMVRYGRSGKVFQCRSAVAICSFELSGLGRYLVQLRLPEGAAVAEGSPGP